MALVAVGVYTLPALVGGLSEVSHELDHLLGEPPGQELFDVAGPTEPGGFVHAHGGRAAHKHDGNVGALLVAAQQTEDHQNEVATAALELMGHLPAKRVVALGSDVEELSSFWDPAAATPAPAFTPPLPPPRA